MGTSVESHELTVVVVNHDTREHLLACLGALPDAGGRLSVRRVVVDNGSADGSVEALLRAFPDVELLTPGANLGFGRACNLALASVRSPFVALLNADVVCAPRCLEKLVEALREHPRAAAVGPRLVNPDGGLQTSAYRSPTLLVEWVSVLGVRAWIPVSKLRSSPFRRWLPATGHFDPHDAPRTVEHVTGACMALRTAAVQEVGGFDERFFLYYEEIDLCRRLRADDWEIRHLPAAEALHHLNRSGAQRPGLAYLARQQSRLLYHDKYEGVTSLVFLRLALALVAAGGYLRRRLGPAVSDARGPTAADYLRVLRWCRRPASIPHGDPRELS